MFTGIIKAVEKVTFTEQKNQSLFVRVGLSQHWKIKEGESISINGVCSTVRAISSGSFEVEYMPETISKTTVLDWAIGSWVNLEQSLTLSDGVDGHLVSGHVDSVASIAAIEEKGDSKVFTIKVARKLLACIAPKGSVALDGVSLTVVDVLDDCFTVSLVSYTLAHTNFGHKKIEDKLHIETDLIAKYIFNILNYATKK